MFSPLNREYHKFVWNTPKIIIPVLSQAAIWASLPLRFTGSPATVHTIARWQFLKGYVIKADQLVLFVM
jgi:hypothetical protein